MSGSRALLSLTVAVVRRPSLWLTALGQVRRLARPGWWRRPPFLPLPPRDYLRFRLQTAYGGKGELGAIRGEDVVTYLAWCRTWNTWSRGRTERGVP